MPLSRITGNSFNATANTNIDNGLLFLNPTTNRVGIGTNVPTANLSLTSTGNTSSDGIRLTFGSEARPHNIYSELATGRDLLIAPYRAVTLRAGTGTTEGEVRLQSYESTIFSTGSSYTERMRITSAGDLVVGDTTSGGYAISARRVNDNCLMRLTAVTLGGAGIDLVNAGGSEISYINAGGSNILVARTGGTERIRITAGGNLLVGRTTDLGSGGIVVGDGSSNRTIVVHSQGGVDGTYVDWLVSAPYQFNSAEQNRIRSSISSSASSSGLQFMISNGGGSSAQTESFRINRTSCTVIGSLSKGSGSFKIKHPLPEKEETHYLVHSFIEGPQADLIYRGKVQLENGTATVNIDTVSNMTEGTFVALNREVQCFTSNETDWDAVRGSVNGNILTIECQNNSSNATVSWMVIGERKDKHMYDTEWTDENGKVIVEPLINPPEEENT